MNKDTDFVLDITIVATQKNKGGQNKGGVKTRRHRIAIAKRKLI